MNNVSVIRGNGPREDETANGQDYGCKVSGSQPIQTPINVNLDERFVSAIAGGFLASSALRSGGPLRGALFGALATGLMQRALTGHCAFYGWIGKTSLRSVYKNQLSGRMKHNDQVMEAGKESFPASDPPSYTGQVGSTDSVTKMPASASLTSPQGGSRATPSIGTGNENNNKKTTQGANI